MKIFLIVFFVLFLISNILALCYLIKLVKKKNEVIYDNEHARGTVRGILGLFESKSAFEKSCKKVASKNFKF